MFLIGIMPFRCMYVFSDFIAFVLYRIAGYRKKVVRQNLVKSFPDKSIEEIKCIEKSFYKHFADITIESFKGFTMSKSHVLKRFVVEDSVVADKYFEQGKDIINLAAHYGNWEWGILSTDLFLKHQVVSLYKPLSNKYIESYSKKRRERFGMQLVSIKKTKGFFMSEKPKNVSYIMAADQSPTDKERMIWVDFLGQKTPCLHGPGVYATKMNIPLVYFDVQRLKRGYYSLKVVDFCENPGEKTPQEITEQYMSKLEKIILNKPEDWLWSHRRWKHA